MLFNSLGFLYFFLPVTYFVFWKLTSKTQRYVWLTITGYVFYSFWNYKFCALMAFSTLVSYYAGLGFLRWKEPGMRRLCLVLPVVADLTLLGVFKYANFAMATAGEVAKAFHLAIAAQYLNVILPVGISFYTFHTITYIVDSCRGKIVPTRNFFEFSCYVSLFAQLVAGPIVRFREVEADLEQIDRPDPRGALSRGFSFFTLGMVKKVLLADSIAMVINPALADWSHLSTGAAWLCALGYTYQLYFDFSGYSDMAVGLGSMFGIHLPQNFNSPYKALDPADFWRRWHISLSSMLRDYLYIPLGGGRSATWMTYRNLLITMLLGGLWHGADWTFVAWGGYHGLLLIGARLGRGALERVPIWLRQLATFLLVVVGWVLFRSASFSMAAGLLGKMFVWTQGVDVTGWPFLTTLLLIAAGLAHTGPNSFELSHRWRPGVTLGLAALFAICMIVIIGGQQSPFLYFQF
jgi:alginate O-acetyltransferase complex protein AlgI